MTELFLSLVNLMLIYIMEKHMRFFIVRNVKGG